jgi:hypothetical protein
VGADGVDKLAGTGNVATNAAVGLTEGSSDDVDAVHDGALRLASLVGFIIEVLSNTGSVGSIHANGVNLVQESDRTVLLSKVANLLDRAN